MIRPLKLPSRSPRARAESKALWNEARSVATADFFTIGYEGRSTEILLEVLHAADVRLLLDIRYSPVSMYRPELSKSNFRNLLEREGFEYLHIPQWGVPRAIRAELASVS
ncbi:MAG TPA: DUF488 family protein [Stellaceae bacterium]|nr:DUF488 family protein [Stellaceae bacterium]